MNSLQQLNAFSNEGIIFTEANPRPFSITTTGGSYTLPTINKVLIEDATDVDCSDFGLTITNIISADDTTSDHITLTFDFSAANNPTVNWPTPPRNVLFSNPTPGVFVASKIQTIPDYLYILANAGIKVIDQTSNFSYTITADWPGSPAYTQTFNTTTITSPETGLNGLSLDSIAYSGSLLFDPADNAQIIDVNDTSTYSLLLSSSLGNTLSIGPGTPSTGITLTGDKATVNAQLDSVYHYPRVNIQGQTDTITYQLTVTNGTQGNYVSETGSFTVAIPNFIQVTNMPSSIVFPDQNDYAIFTGITAPTVVDPTGDYNLLSFTFDASSLASPGNFNSGSGASVTVSGYVNPNPGDPDINGLIAAVTYDPENYLIPTTETIAWSLALGGLTLQTGTIDFEIPEQIEMIQFTDPGYTSHEYNTQLFPSGPFRPRIQDNVDPNRTLTLNVAVTSTNTKVFVPGSTFPYPTTLTYSGNETDINALLVNIGVVPDPDANAFDIEFEIVDNTTVLNSTTVTVNKTASGAFATFDQIYTTDFTITDEMYYFGKMDALLISGGGGAGYHWPGYAKQGAGGGGDGLIADYRDLNLDTIPINQRNVEFVIGYGGNNATTHTLSNGYTGGQTALRIAPSTGGPISDLYRVQGGGGGGSGRWLDTNFNIIRYSGDGNQWGGGGGIFDQSVTNTIGLGDDDILSPPLLAIAVTSGYTTVVANAGSDGEVRPATPSYYGGDGADNTLITSNYDPNGVNRSYFARGAASTYEGWPGGTYPPGQDGDIIVRIRAR